MNLADLRRQSGLPMKEVISRATKIDPLFPLSEQGLAVIETRGTRDYWQIMALAEVYSLHHAELARIAAPKEPKRKLSKRLKISLLPV